MASCLLSQKQTNKLVFGEIFTPMCALDISAAGYNGKHQLIQLMVDLFLLVQHYALIQMNWLRTDYVSSVL